MRMGKMMSILGAAATLSFLVSSFPAVACAGGRPMIRLADFDGGNGGGTSVNLTVRKVTVQPIRAYIGDVIDVEVWIENREDGSETSWAEVYANKKVVAKEMFRWGTPGMERTYKLYIKWDTRGMAPGEYKVKVEAYVSHDVDPFDNDLTMSKPIVLAAPGSGFPGGEQAGGSVTEIDPRYK